MGAAVIHHELQHLHEMIEVKSNGGLIDSCCSNDVLIITWLEYLFAGTFNYMSLDITDRIKYIYMTRFS